MPIDPNILMQGAQLQIASRNQLSNDLDNALKLYQDAKTKGFDFDKLSQRAAIKAMNGTATADDYNILGAKDLLDGQKIAYTQAPSGELIPTTQPSIMDRLQGMGARQYNPSYPPLGAAPTPNAPMIQPTVNATGAEGALGPIPSIADSLLGQSAPGISSKPPAALTPQQQEALNARGDVMNRPAMPLPQITPPAGAGPKTVQAAQEANVELSKTAAQSDIAAPAKGAEAYATKTGQLAAENEAKLPAIQGFIQELTSFGEENVKKLPSGTGESIAAWVSNKAGYPTESAIAQADLDSRLPLLMGQAKQIVRQAGEGTFTDYDAKALTNMIWESNDSTPVKLKKYETILGAMQRAEKRITGKSKEFTSQNKPGFKYLGSE